MLRTCKIISSRQRTLPRERCAIGRLTPLCLDLRARFTALDDGPPSQKQQGAGLACYCGVCTSMMERLWNQLSQYRASSTPFLIYWVSHSDETRTRMSEDGDFLGVVHNYNRTTVSSKVTCTPRPMLLTKAIGMLHGFLGTSSRSPAEASKSTGIQGFVNAAFFGQLSKADLHLFKERLYLNAAPWTLSHTMRRAIDFYTAISTDCPKRTMQLRTGRAIGVPWWRLLRVRPIRWA